jgi:hypothetical protein
VRERSNFLNHDPPVTLVSVRRGELEQSGKVAREVMHSRDVRGTGADTITCEGRASFSARERE